MIEHIQELEIQMMKSWSWGWDEHISRTNKTVKKLLIREESRIGLRFSLVRLKYYTSYLSFAYHIYKNTSIAFVWQQYISDPILYTM